MATPIFPSSKIDQSSERKLDQSSKKEIDHSSRAFVQCEEKIDQSSKIGQAGTQAGVRVCVAAALAPPSEDEGGERPPSKKLDCD